MPYEVRVRVRAGGGALRDLREGRVSAARRAGRARRRRTGGWAQAQPNKNTHLLEAVEVQLPLERRVPAVAKVERQHLGGEAVPVW